MFVTLISSFKITLTIKLCIIFSRLSCLLLYSYCASLLQPLTIWSILSSTFLQILHKESPWLLPIFALTRFVLILWLWAANIRLSVSLFKSPFRSQPQNWSLFTSLVCFKYWPCRNFSSLNSNFFSFFDLFKHLQLLNHLSYLFKRPVSIFFHFHEHTLPNLLLLTQHNLQWIIKPPSASFFRYIWSAYIWLRV